MANDIRRYIRLLEADVVDFDAFRRNRKDGKAGKVVPDDIRYAAALDAQSPSKPETVSDYLRAIVLRNIDAAFGNGEWNPDDLKQLRAFLRGSAHFKRSGLSDSVRKALKLAGQRDSTTYSIGYASKREAYLKDDPVLAKSRLERRVGKYGSEVVESFDSLAALYHHILKTMVEPESGDWSTDELVKITEFTTDYESSLTQNNIDNWKPYDDEEVAFDPDAVPMDWEGKPEPQWMIPAVQKFLERFKADYSSEDGVRQPYILSREGFDGEFSITFVSPHAPESKMTFPDMRAMERWVLAHRRGIEQWYAAEKSSDGSAAQGRTIDRLTKGVVRMIQTILKARESGQTLDEAKIGEWCDRFRDASWTLRHEKLRDFFQSLIFDIRRPALRENLSDFHLTWIPETVTKLRNEVTDP